MPTFNNEKEVDQWSLPNFETMSTPQMENSSTLTGQMHWNCSCQGHMVAPRQLVNVKLWQTLDESWTDLRTFWSLQECRLGASLHFTEEITRVQMSKLLLKVHPEVCYWTRSILGEHLFFSLPPPTSTPLCRCGCVCTSVWVCRWRPEVNSGILLYHLFFEIESLTKHGVCWFI